MAPSAVNNGARALEGLIARYFFDNDTSVLATLSGSLITIIANRNSLTLTGTTSNYLANFMQAFTMGANPNTGPVRVTIDGVGPISVRDNAGASLSSSVLLAGTRALIVKDGTNDYFRLLYPPGTVQSVVGKHTIWVPASAMRPTVSNGCASLVDIETTAGRPDMQVLDFNNAADEHAQFSVAFPRSWNRSTVTFRAFWTTAGVVTTGVAIALQGVAVSDNDTIDVAYGTAVVVTDDALNAAEDLMVTAESAAITIAGTPADEDTCFFRVFRDVGDANDDMTQDMRLIGIQLYYTIDTGEDT